MNITIVQYLTPYSIRIRNSQELANFEQISEELKTLRTANPITANVNQFVAVKDGDVYKRAVITNAVSDGYQCWLLDFAESTFTNCIYKLSEKLASMPVTVTITSVNNIVGVHHRLNVITGNDEVELRPYFHGEAIRYVDTKLHEAKTIYFYEESKVGDVLCGSFLLEMSDGLKFNLTDLLIQHNYAKLVKELFLRALLDISSKIPTIVTYDDTMSECTNVRSIEGVGRGNHRVKIHRHCVAAV